MRDLPPWELGSEFGWDQDAMLPAGAPPVRWQPAGALLYASATGALVALLRTIGRRRRLYLPSFFCMDVAAQLAGHADLRWDRQLPDPQQLEPPAAGSGDVVLAVNLFGRDTGSHWADWSHQHPDALLVADHSHDPLSEWAASSTAAYGVASLRKTMPLPDGALLWSPTGRALPTPPSGLSEGSARKLAAMVLKSGWLAGAAVGKADFRALQIDGERLLVGTEAAASPTTAAALPLLDAWRLRSRRADNARTLAELLTSAAGAGDPSWRVLESTVPPGGCPFHVQLLCRSGRTRDALLQHLRADRIYAPVHWRQPAYGVSSGEPEACELAGRILTVPTDHRYGADDMERVARTLSRFDG